MRLPWIQVTEEAWGMAKMLAGILPRTKRREAFGLLADLWAWGLGLGPADEPPAGVLRDPLALQMLAGALEWTRDPEELARALKAVGALDILPDGIRVRGTNRYHAAWRKNRGTSGKTDPDQNGDGAPTDTHQLGSAPGSERVPNGFRTGPGEIPPGSAPEPARKTETQTERKSETEKRARAVAGPVVSGAIDAASASLRAAADAGGLVNGQPLGEAIEDAFRSERKGAVFRWTHKERDALHRLLGEHESKEILRRWKIGLGARFRTASSLTDLERDWNAHAQAPPERDGRPRVPARAEAPTGPPCPVEGCGEPANDKARAAKGVCLGCGNEWQAAWQDAGCPGDDFGAAHFERWLANKTGAASAKEAS